MYTWPYEVGRQLVLTACLSKRFYLAYDRGWHWGRMVLWYLGMVLGDGSCNVLSRTRVIHEHGVAYIVYICACVIVWGSGPGNILCPTAPLVFRPSAGG